MLQCVAVCCRDFLTPSRVMSASDMTVCCIVLQYVAVYSGVLQCFFGGNLSRVMCASDMSSGQSRKCLSEFGVAT